MVASEVDWKKVVEVMVLKPEQMVDIDYSRLIKEMERRENVYNWKED